MQIWKFIRCPSRSCQDVCHKSRRCHGQLQRLAGQSLTHELCTGRNRAKLLDWIVGELSFRMVRMCSNKYSSIIYRYLHSMTRLDSWEFQREIGRKQTINWDKELLAVYFISYSSIGYMINKIVSYLIEYFSVSALFFFFTFSIDYPCFSYCFLFA